ncbi:permease prefix domain 2-containing transporter [Caulobacter sp. S45]|uniref:permease prefix domain 2-containing transporter n=1 Tax=Caulobacter sp. S45 TaxID=1641861 RepID=UPI00352B4536
MPPLHTLVVEVQDPAGIPTHNLVRFALEQAVLSGENPSHVTLVSPSRQEIVIEVSGHSTMDVLRQWTARQTIISKGMIASTLPLTDSPPRSAERWLSFVCPARQREEKLGDAAESFAKSCARLGPGWARVLYWRDVASVTVGNLVSGAMRLLPFGETLWRFFGG